jgi:hypothetical protein
LNADGYCIYTPNDDVKVRDSFTYLTTPPMDNSNIAQVNFTIFPINDWPVVNAFL